MSTLIPSTTGPAKAWAVSFNKQPKRAGYWSATEVEVMPKSEGDHFTGYKFDLFGAKRVRGEPVPPPCTQKRQDAAYQAFVASLKAQGLVREPPQIAAEPTGAHVDFLRVGA